MVDRQIVQFINEVLKIDISEDSVLLVRKFISRVKKGVFYVSLISHVTNNEFNKTGLFDVNIFAVEKRNFLRTIYNSIKLVPIEFYEDASLDMSYQRVTYNLDDVINNYF